MKYALVNNIKSEALKGLKGKCQCCASEVIAKCGAYRIHHWSHKKTKSCDPWWETETEWHRRWKNCYPSNWHEFLFEDAENNEKHIADIHTEHNLVIEFQHSHIDPNERVSREKFYKNMIWVVDGTRLQRDYPRFQKWANGYRTAIKKDIFIVDSPEDVFPKNWLNSSVPVIFDFKGMEELVENNDLRHKLYCLFQVKINHKSKYLIAVISRKAFIKTTITGDWEIKFQEYIENLKPKEEQTLQKQEIQAKPLKKQGSHYYDPKKGKLIKRWRF